MIEDVTIKFVVFSDWGILPSGAVVIPLLINGARRE